MEMLDCCKRIMMGYISINPKLCLCTWLLETLMLEYDFDLKLYLYTWLLGRAQFKPCIRERFKEHLKQPSPIHAHIQQTRHNTTDNSFNIIGREDEGLARTIKESIYIRVNNPTLNQNIVSTTSVIYGTKFFLTSQGLNWALPNSLAHKHNLRSKSYSNINVSNSHVQEHTLGLMLIYPIIIVLQQP